MNEMDYRLLDAAMSDAYTCLDRLTSMLDKLVVVRRDGLADRPKDRQEDHELRTYGRGAPSEDHEEGPT